MRHTIFPSLHVISYFHFTHQQLHVHCSLCALPCRYIFFICIGCVSPVLGIHFYNGIIWRVTVSRSWTLNHSVYTVKQITCIHDDHKLFLNVSYYKEKKHTQTYLISTSAREEAMIINFKCFHTQRTLKSIKMFTNPYNHICVKKTLFVTQ